MKPKLLLLFGIVIALSTLVTLNSCVNGVDDEYLELQSNNQQGGNKPGDEVKLPDLNGDYTSGGEWDLRMSYNGEELKGKKVTIAADDTNETAIITLAGGEQDLTQLLGGLLEFKYTDYSPIPGVEELVIPNVKLFKNGERYLFRGEHDGENFHLSYFGTVEDGKMEIELQHRLKNESLVGRWDLAPKKETGTTTQYSPLWLDWASEVKVSLGKISSFNLSNRMNGIFSLLAGAISKNIMQQIVGQKIGLQDIILNMLKSIEAAPDGSMIATYSYSGDVGAPAWSSNMPHNALRYYFDPQKPESRIYLVIDNDMLMGLIGGLAAPATRAIGRGTRAESPITREADPETTKRIGRELIEMLKPLLRRGIPCDYTVDEAGAMVINIDGALLRDVLRKLLELANDEVARPAVEEFLWANVGDFAPNLLLMLDTMPNALIYGAESTDENGVKIYSGECAYVNLGLKLKKGN